MFRRHKNTDGFPRPSRRSDIQARAAEVRANWSPAERERRRRLGHQIATTWQTLLMAGELCDI
jgi:hypothetical protein